MPVVTSPICMLLRSSNGCSETQASSRAPTKVAPRTMSITWLTPEVAGDGANFEVVMNWLTMRSSRLYRVAVRCRPPPTAANRHRDRMQRRSVALRSVSTSRPAQTSDSGSTASILGQQLDPRPARRRRLALDVIVDRADRRPRITSQPKLVRLCGTVSVMTASAVQWNRMPAAAAIEEIGIASAEEIERDRRRAAEPFEHRARDQAVAAAIDHRHRTAVS